MGAFGATGRGTEEHTGSESVDILIATLGKAFGVNGGYVVAGDTILAAGVPLQSTFTLPQLSASYAGERGGVLWTASAKDGTKIAEFQLPAQPVWDGLAAAHGQCFITLKDGTVMCLGAK